GKESSGVPANARLVRAGICLTTRRRRANTPFSAPASRWSISAPPGEPFGSGFHFWLAVESAAFSWHLPTLSSEMLASLRRARYTYPHGAIDSPSLAHHDPVHDGSEPAARRARP